MKLRIDKRWVRRLTEEYPILHKIFEWSDGLDWELTKKEEQREDKYIFGASPVQKEILVENGDWTPYWPSPEWQLGRIETWSCTFFGLLNCVEALAKRKWNIVWNKSERFNAGMVKVAQGKGYTLSGALDSARKHHGLVEEIDYPNNIETINWAEWIQTAPKEVQEEGLKWLNQFTLQFEEMPTGLAGIKTGLKYSPIYGAGSSWYRRSNGEYYSGGTPNHCFAIKRVNGNNLIAGDSYDPFEKRLASDYKFYYPRILVLNKRVDLEFNTQVIEKFKKERKKEFLLLVEDFTEAFTRGLYKITSDNKLEKVNSVQTVNEWIIEKAKEGSLVGVDVSFFSTLFKKE